MVHVFENAVARLCAYLHAVHLCPVARNVRAPHLPAPPRYPPPPTRSVSPGKRLRVNRTDIPPRSCRRVDKRRKRSDPALEHDSRLAYNGPEAQVLR